MTQQTTRRRSGNSNNDTRLARVPVTFDSLSALEVAHSSNDPDLVTKTLIDVQTKVHLISPSPQCSNLPDGCEAMMSRIMIDSDENNGEIYAIAGTNKAKWGLTKVALEKISLAAGITWNPRESRRDDDCSNADFCQYTAVGHYYDFDGKIQTLIGTKAIDLRRGSAMWEDAHERGRDKAIEAALDRHNTRKLSPEQHKDALTDGVRRAEKELRHARIHILSNAQSKARNRAIRSMGLRSSYRKTEFAKPFAAVKLIFTGRTDNPVNSEIYARARAEHFLGAKAAAYGDLPTALPASAAPRALMPPPPVHRGPDPDDMLDNVVEGAEVHDGENGNDTHDTEPRNERKNESTRTAQPADDKTTTGDAANRPRPADFEVRFGRDKGKMVSDLDDRGLSFLIDVYTSSIENPEKADWKEKNTRDRAIVYEWINYWASEDGDNGELFDN